MHNQSQGYTLRSCYSAAGDMAVLRLLSCYNKNLDITQLWCSKCHIKPYKCTCSFEYTLEFILYELLISSQSSYVISLLRFYKVDENSVDPGQIVLSSLPLKNG